MNVSQNITEGVVKSVSGVKQYAPGKDILSFTILTKDQYPVMLEFGLFGERIIKHQDKIKQGSTLKIQFNIKSNEYNDRLYYNLSPWSIESIADESVEPEPEVVDPDLDEDVPF